MEFFEVGPSAFRKRAFKVRRLLLAQHDVHGFRSTRVLGTAEAQREQVDVYEQLLARSENDRRNSEVDFIDKSGAQKLADRRNATSDPNILSICGRGSTLGRGVNTLGDKMKRCTSRHGDRRARVVGEHEDRSVIRGIVAPPALPALIGPRSSHRPEHVAPDDPGADVVETATYKVVIDSYRSTLRIPVQALESAGREHPVEQRPAADSEWILQALTGASSIAINGDSE